MRAPDSSARGYIFSAGSLWFLCAQQTVQCGDTFSLQVCCGLCARNRQSARGHIFSAGLLWFMRAATFSQPRDTCFPLVYAGFCAHNRQSAQGYVFTSGLLWFVCAQQTVSPGMQFHRRFVVVYVRPTDSQPGDTFSPPVYFGFCCLLVLSSMSSMWFSWVSSDISVTYLFIPFTIITHERIPSPNKELIRISIP